MNQRHGWGQVSGHCLFSCCSKHSGEGHCKVGLASFVPRFDDSAHMREKIFVPQLETGQSTSNKQVRQQKGQNRPN